jgi:TonB family protein
MHRGVRAYIAAICALPICVGAQESRLKVYDREDGVVMPVLVKSVAAHYTAEAFKGGIEGWNMVEAIVLPDGTVGDVTIVCSLDQIHGLDQAVVQAARKWTFKPGTKDGTPVAVRVTIKNAFTQGGKKPKMRAPTPTGNFPCND